jgi:tRNA(Ile)-lysidine synthase TilS/MesJ
MPSACLKECFRCKAQPGCAASRDGKIKPYCRDCFKRFVDTTVREAFFRHCGVPTDVPVVLAVSGGAGSMAAMRIAAAIRTENLSRGGHGKINYNLNVLHIDEGALCSRLPGTTTHTASVARTVQQTAEAAGLPCVVLPLERLVDLDTAAVVHSTAPLTDREDLYHILRRDAILNAASALGAHAVVFGDNGTTSAWRSLGELVRGRGEHVRTFCGSHGLLQVGPRRELFLFRPMRGILAKEAALFCRYEGIPFAYLPTPATGTSARSIDRALETFVAGLEQQFRSIVFNILNSVDRMGPQVDADSLNRGSSTVTKPDGSGKRALKQHLHEVIVSMLRSTAGGWFASRPPSASTTNESSDPKTSVQQSHDSDEQQAACAVCAAPLKRTRTESEPSTGANACYGCRMLSRTAQQVACSSERQAALTAGEAIGALRVDTLLAELRAEGVVLSDVGE